ncbi:MAG: hypothetical protein ACT4OS_04205 [Acidimicrobiales bacterium]
MSRRRRALGLAVVLGASLVACSSPPPKAPRTAAASTTPPVTVDSQAANRAVRAALDRHRAALKPVAAMIDRLLDSDPIDLEEFGEAVSRRADLERAYGADLAGIVVPGPASDEMDRVRASEGEVIDALDVLANVDSLLALDAALDELLDRADLRLVAEDALFAVLGMDRLLSDPPPAPAARGTVLFEDGFASVLPGIWKQVNSPEFLLAVEAGRYRVTSREPGRTVIADSRSSQSSGAPLPADLTDVSVEVDVVKGQSSTARFGLVCHSDTTAGSAYLGLIDTHGGWSIGKLDRFKFTALAGPSPPADSIKPALAVNRLRFDCRQQGRTVRIDLYANDRRVGEATDSAGLDPGAVGLAVANFRGRCCGSAVFDDVVVRTVGE